MSYSDAATEVLEHSLRPVIMALMVGPNLHTQVNFYSYKELSPDMDRDNVNRPAVIVAQKNIGDGERAQIAGPWPVIGRQGIAIYVETPISVTEQVSATQIDSYGGRDTILQPITRAIESWFKSHPALRVPASIRYQDGNPALEEYFPYDAIDMRRANPFRLALRQREYEGFVYYPILEFLEVQSE